MSHPFEWNKIAWNAAVSSGDNPYTWVVSPEDIAQARLGNWQLKLSDQKSVPRHWFPDSLKGLDILCLASGGGQQAPILAAAGGMVSLLDASAAQLNQDRFVANRDSLDIKFNEGDMADLSMFAGHSFDLIINPPSTLFAPDLAPIWSECARVLRPGGILMTGFMNPDEFIFDHIALEERQEFVVRYGLPYIEHETLSEQERQSRVEQKEMFHFSHTMESQLGGLMDAGFVMTHFYEDRRPEEDGNRIRFYIPSYFVGRFRKEGA